MGTRLFVGNLSFNTTSEELSELFSQAGTCKSATVMTGPGFLLFLDESGDPTMQYANRAAPDPPAVIVVEDYKQETKDGKEEETGKARKLRVKVGLRDRVLHLVEIVALDDPEKKWQGTLESAKFVVERGQGLRNGDAMKLEVDED